MSLRRQLKPLKMMGFRIGDVPFWDCMPLDNEVYSGEICEVKSLGRPVGKTMSCTLILHTEFFVHVYNYVMKTTE